jgi:hypothetical protein
MRALQMKVLKSKCIGTRGIKYFINFHAYKSIKFWQAGGSCRCNGRLKRRRERESMGNIKNIK